MNTTEKIVIKSNYTNVVLPVKDIVFIEAMKDWVVYHMKDGAKHMTLKTMKNASEELKDYGILRCHRSYMVNKSHVTEYKSKKAYVEKKMASTPDMHEFEIPIGRHYRDEFKSCMNAA